MNEMHPVRTASIPWAVFKAVTSRACLPLLAYIFTVISSFLLPQLVARLFPRHHTVISVDHPLDDLIPFEPDRVGVYLSFVEIWIRGLSLIRRQLGRSANRDTARFLNGLSQAYRQARSVYKQYLSTTRRPDKPANASFRMIYAFDPHFNCVPSLHIMIVCHTFLEIEAIYQRHGQAELGISAVAELYAQALSISETVVFVKQHSINCISAALYMTSNLQPQFDRAAGLAFVARLFHGQLSAADREAVVRHVTALYVHFMDDPRTGSPDYSAVLVDFLREYPARLRLDAGQAKDYNFAQDY